MREHYLITGGAGFVGSHACRTLLEQGKKVTCYDMVDPKSAHTATLLELARNPNFEFVRGNILDLPALERVLGRHPDAVLHFGAISAVDRSIRNPLEAIAINGMGTANVLEAARQNGVPRFHYVSTDEVFGHSVHGAFDEGTQCSPRNPYAAGKLAGEAAALAYGTTFGMEVTITNCVNNYGSHQAPDKLIPRLTVRGLTGNKLPVYGDGKQVREWIYVDDHVKAVLHVLDHGTFGERYCVGTGETHQNIEIVQRIMAMLNLDESSIAYVEDRKGHDLRYAVDATKLQLLGWKPEHSFQESLDETINWYKDNQSWWRYFIAVYPDLVPNKEPSLIAAD